jgi:hypothetical protein
MPKKEVVELDDELDARFRQTIAQKKGLRKGVIKEAFEEAVRAWIEKNRK